MDGSSKATTRPAWRPLATAVEETRLATAAGLAGSQAAAARGGASWAFNPGLSWARGLAAHGAHLASNRSVPVRALLPGGLVLDLPGGCCG
jgi:hypothetical protein